MKAPLAQPKKSPSSKPRNKKTPRRANPAKAALRKEMRAWRETWPTALERDTMLVPEWVAETVVQEAERFLKADLPAGFAERLAARAYYLYPRHKYFHKGLNRPGNGGRATLLMFMRHWTAAWLKRERSALYKKLPYSFGMGQRLPLGKPCCKTPSPPPTSK